jgi:hypothetical protein
MAPLERIRAACMAGNLAAAVDALDHSQKRSEPLPAWTHAAIRTLAFQGIQSNKRWRRRYRQDMIDYIRWDAVNELRNRVDEFGLTWRDTYETVSKYFEGTPAAGGVDAIERSYKLCQSRMKKDPFRYYNAACTETALLGWKRQK